MKAKNASVKFLFPLALFLLNSEITSLLALIILMVMFLSSIKTAAEDRR